MGPVIDFSFWNTAVWDLNRPHLQPRNRMETRKLGHPSHWETLMWKAWELQLEITRKFAALEVLIQQGRPWKEDQLGT